MFNSFLFFNHFFDSFGPFVIYMAYFSARFYIITLRFPA